MSFECAIWGSARQDHDRPATTYGNGAPVSQPDLTIRTVRITDKAALIDLFERLSARSRYYRFLGPKKVLSPDELENLTDLDHIEREAVALVAPDGRFIAVARYGPAHDDPNAAEVALTVADEWQGRGIGSAMASLLIAKAQRHGFGRLRAMTLAENYQSRKLLRRLGFTVYVVNGPVISLEMQLAGSEGRSQAPLDDRAFVETFAGGGAIAT